MKPPVLAGPLMMLSLVAGAAACRADTKPQQAERSNAPLGLGYAGSAALAATLSRADVAMMRSAIRPNLIKGGFGEAHMNRHLVGYLKQAGNWSPLSARMGPQGLDGLLIKYDAAGVPCGLIVSEAKYGASRLKMTADGVQMGTRWRSVRLSRMAAEYRSIARTIRSGEMAVAGSGGSVGKQRLQFPLADGGKVAVFARSGSNAAWEFVGPRVSMGQAGQQADRVGNYLQLASEGKVGYESPVYRIVLKNKTMRITVSDASLMGDRLGEAALPVRTTITLPLGADRLNQLRNMGRVEIAKILRQKYPALASFDVDHYSREIVRTTRDFEKLLFSRPGSVSRTIAANSLKLGGSLAVIDVVFQSVGQYRMSGSVNWQRVALSGGVTLGGTALGSAAGQGAIVFMTENPLAYQFMSRSSTILGLGSRSLATNIVGGAFGGGAAALFLSYGGYFAGLYDLQTANRQAVAGSASAVAGAAFFFGMPMVATAFGTASTGTALATLHGAALTSATHAWLGGGALAAGGFGGAGGVVLLTGGTALVVIGAGAAVYAVFSYSDQKQDCERIRLMLDDLSHRKSFTSSGMGTRKFQSLVIGKK